MSGVVAESQPRLVKAVAIQPALAEEWHHQDDEKRKSEQMRLWVDLANGKVSMES